MISQRVKEVEEKVLDACSLASSLARNHAFDFQQGEHDAPKDLLGLLVACKDENGAQACFPASVITAQCPRRRQAHERATNGRRIDGVLARWARNDKVFCLNSLAFTQISLASTLMTWLLFSLANNPEIDEKLYRYLKEREDGLKKSDVRFV